MSKQGDPSLFGSSDFSFLLRSEAGRRGQLRDAEPGGRFKMGWEGEGTVSLGKGQQNMGRIGGRGRAQDRGEVAPV